MEILKIDGLSVHHIYPELSFTLSMQLNAGEIIGINGASGVGKSLIFKAIADLIAHQGYISLDHQNKNNFSAAQWRKKVMLVPAESQWWFENVGEHFHALDKTLFKQLGLDKSILSRHIHEISSGEKQRLALLRAIQYQPEVLLLDEPTANLDKTNSVIIEEFIGHYSKKNKAILWISHNREQIKRIANYMLVINKDKVSKNTWK
jgi:ABC-type iron transport system FetAB ATPase subunit